MKKLLKSYLFDGLLLIALGIVMLVWPNTALKTVCIVAGAIVAVMGVIKIVAFFTNKSGERSAMDIVRGVVLLAVGIALMVASGFFIGVFQYVVGVILAYGAILMFVQAFMLRKEKGALMILSLVFAIITTVLAVVIFMNPTGFAAFMMQLEGISLIVEGLAMIIVLRKSLKELNPKKNSGEND